MVVRKKIEWDTIKVIRGESSNGITSAIKINMGVTENGSLSFSYVFGAYRVDPDEEMGERWLTYSFILDRHAPVYLNLFEEALSLVRGAMTSAERDENGRLTPDELRKAVLTRIQRRRG